MADEAGIESLTMRKLGQALGVEAMSLYNHFANKDAILAGIVDLVVGEIELPSLDEEWDVAVRRCAISAHEVFLRHSWACALAMSPRMAVSSISARMRYIEGLLGRLRLAGFSPDLTYHAYHALDSHVLGFTLWEIGHTVTPEADEEIVAQIVRDLSLEEFPYLAEHAEQHFADVAPDVDGVGEFEFGLDLVLDGLKRLLAVQVP
jgi:AcrR family transcriptional regulator